MAARGWDLYLEYPHMDQRRPQWEAVAQFTDAQTALYPGSFVDVSPSFVFDHVSYMDMDKRCPAFFADDNVRRRVPHDYTFIHQDYREPVDVAPVDLLISQYAGPISHHCKHAVRKGGHLVANNSHADAGVAALDPDWELVGVLRGNKVSTTSLDQYFIPKRKPAPRRDELIASQKGMAYTKTAPNYVFRRV